MPDLEHYKGRKQHLEAQPDSSYPEIFCKAMSMPLVTEKELVAFLNHHEHVTLRLPGTSRRRPSIKRDDDRVIWGNDPRD